MSSLKPFFRREAVPLTALIIVTLIVFGYLLDFLVLQHRARDYNLHIYFAEMLRERQFYAVHIVFHALVVILSLPQFINMVTAAYLIALIFYAATAAILYALLRGVTSNRLLAAVGALALMLVTPITLPTWAQSNLYFGYIGVNVLHNPTMVLLKPLGLIGFAYALRALQGTLTFRPLTALLCAALIAVSMFTKPNFALVLLPALIVVMGYRALRREPQDARLLIVGFIVPMIALLPVQYVLQYVLIPSDRANGLALAPFATYYLYDQSFWSLGLKFVMSIAFPLTVTLLYRKTMRHDLGVALAWWAFLAGWAQSVLFAEVGVHALDGNFWWSAQMGLFLLFVYTALHWIRAFKREPRAWISLAVFGLHLASGIALIVATLTAVSEFSVW